MRKKLVRCQLRSPGGAPYTRFVPLIEFKLWQYFISHAHGKIVEGENISLWLDAESFRSNSALEGRPTESVLRVRVEYWDEAKQTTSHAVRYFPSDDYDCFREVFLEHYPEGASDDRLASKRRVTETGGYFLLPPATH